MGSRSGTGFFPDEGKPGSPLSHWSLVIGHSTMPPMAPNGPTPLILPTRVRYGVLVFICTLALITYLDRVCISRVQGEIQHDLSISSQGMGLVFGAFLLGYALFEVPGGWMGDIWGSRRVVFRIVVWWSLFTALTGCVWASSTAGMALVLTALVCAAGAFPVRGRRGGGLPQPDAHRWASGFHTGSGVVPRGPSGCRPGWVAPSPRW